MKPEQTYRLGLLLLLTGGFHTLKLYGEVGTLGLILVYAGGVIGVIGVLQAERTDSDHDPVL